MVRIAAMIAAINLGLASPPCALPLDTVICTAAGPKRMPLPDDRRDAAAIACHATADIRKRAVR